MPPVWKGSNCKADVAIIEKQIKHQWANQTKRQRERVIVMNIRWKCTVYHGLAHAGYLTSGLITCTGLKFLSRGTFSYTVYTICTARSLGGLCFAVMSNLIHSATEHLFFFCNLEHKRQIWSKLSNNIKGDCIHLAAVFLVQLSLKTGADCPLRIGSVV